MSLPNNALYERFAQINVGGRLFESPPFSLEFTQTLKIGRLTQTKAKLYNPAPDTIKLAEPKKIGRRRQFTEVIIDAGYIDDWGTAALGLIHDYKVVKRGPDTILEMSIGDATNKWNNNLINKTWKNTYANIIVNEMLSSAGIVGEVQLGESKLYRTFTARLFRTAIQKIVKDTDSQWYFKNGIFKIEPKDAPRERQVLFISPDSGLLDKIEKNKKGFKFKTLFFYKLNAGDILQIEDKNTPVSTVKIYKGKKVFSSFGRAHCIFEAREI